MRGIDADQRASVDGNADRQQLRLQSASTRRQEQVLAAAVILASRPMHEVLALQAVTIDGIRLPRV